MLPYLRFAEEPLETGSHKPLTVDTVESNPIEFFVTIPKLTRG